jgi:hypothetical protein
MRPIGRAGKLGEALALVNVEGEREPACACALPHDDERRLLVCFVCCVMSPQNIHCHCCDSNRRGLPSLLINCCS